MTRSWKASFPRCWPSRSRPRPAWPSCRPCLPPPMTKISKTATTPACCPLIEVKSKKDELKAFNAEVEGPTQDHQEPGEPVTEMKAADKLPPGQQKGLLLHEGLTAKDAEFENGLRIVDWRSQGHSSEWIARIA
jgi:hypothetical protein